MFPRKDLKDWGRGIECQNICGIFRICRGFGLLMFALVILYIFENLGKYGFVGDFLILNYSKSGQVRFR